MELLPLSFPALRSLMKNLPANTTIPVKYAVYGVLVLDHVSRVCYFTVLTVKYYEQN